MNQTPTPSAARAAGGAGSLQRGFVATLPWAIIAGLLYAGFYIELSPVGETVQPPALELRDQYYGIVVPASGTLWMAGGYGKIVRSDDGGRTWQRQPTPIDSHLQDIAAWDAQRAVAVGNRGDVIITGDGGATWQSVEVPRSDVANKLLRVRIAADGRAWAVGEFGMLVHSTDFGRTWSRLGEPRDVTYADIAVLDDGRLLVVAEFGKTFVSTDAGLTWREVQAPVQSSLTGVAFRDALNGVAVGLDGVILTTADAGETWMQRERSETGVSAGADVVLAVPAAAIGKREIVGDLVSEHLLGVIWAPAAGRWIAAGNKGVVAVGNAAGDSWETRQVAPRDVAWHTGLAVDGEQVYMAGRNAGVWADGKWEVFFGRKGGVAK